MSQSNLDASGPPSPHGAAASTPLSAWGWLKNAKLWALVGLSVVAGSALGLLVVPRAPSPEQSIAQPERLELLGATFAVSEHVQEQASTRVHDYLSRTFTLHVPGEPSVAMTLAKWGVQHDEQRLAVNLQDARDPTSPLRKEWAERAVRPVQPSGQDVLTLAPPLLVDREVTLARLLPLKGRFDRSPQDARLDLAAQRVVPEINGRWLDIDATLFRMESAMLRGDLQAEAVVLVRTPPKVKKQLAGLSFDAVLGHFETRYSPSQKYADRTFNLRLAAQKLDGTVLLPGEVFDFNEVVGPRDEAAGYRVATVIADGELVDGIGGGTCQISGTLHGAAFFAGLELVERYPHTRPSSYIKMGMDATVVYPTINFRFRNSFAFPVAIHQTVSDGKVRAEILGAKVDQVVTLIRTIDEALSYEQLERKDPNLPRGTRVLAQRGVPGFRLHRYRTIRRGSHTQREKWRDIYPPTPQVIRIGTGEANLPEKGGVDTPEYRADELLILTLTRSEDGSPGKFAENREPGRFGVEGWTQAQRMPFWND